MQGGGGREGEKKRTENIQERERKVTDQRSEGFLNGI